MFILRIVFKSGLVHNHILGNDYKIIRPENESDFRHLLKTACHKEETKAFIQYDKNDWMTSWPIYPNHQYYIMTDSGKTFEKINVE
jgi:hypothetical protein